MTTTTTKTRATKANKVTVDRKQGRVDGLSVSAIALGAALVASSLACGDDAIVAGGGDQGDSASSAPTSPAGAEDGPRGRAFGDTSSPGPSGPTSAETKIAASGAAPKGAGGAAKPKGLSEFASTVDPSRLTPEALAKNPLVMGVKKREPFVLPEGADPLDPNVYGWDKDEDGHWIIDFGDLSLEEKDKEMLLDALVYPEEYEDEDVTFPDRIRALDGEKVALTGYMIATEWEDSKVKSFMLVRDLMACCFGGNPEADEWVDVLMVEGGCDYIEYIPVVTRGVFQIQGVADEAGYATGAFQMEATDVKEE